MYEILAFSDVHLGDKDCKADILLKVLNKVKAKKILIVGDLFDHHNLKRLKKNHWKVLSKLRKLSKKYEIIYLIGNHCFLKAEFMSILLGFKCKNEYSFDINNKKFICLHGDIFDLYFTKLKWITNVLVKFYFFIRDLHPYAEDFFKKSSNSFTEKTANLKNNAINYCKIKQKDSIICGHSHTADHDNVKNIEYINTGSFCELKSSYVVINKKGVAELIYLD